VPAPDAPAEYLQAIWGRWAALKEGSHLKTQVLGMNPDGTAAETLERLDFPVTGLPDLNDATLTHLASATGRPKEILGGLQPTGIINSGASWQDGWYKEVDDWREGDLRAALEYLIPILYMADQGYVPENWTLEYEPLGRLSAKDQAEVDKLEAETLAIYVEVGALVVDQIRRSKFGPGSTPPAGLQPATEEEMAQTPVASPLPLAVRNDPVARAQATMDASPDSVWVGLELDPVAFGSLVMQARAVAPSLRPEPWGHVTLCHVGATSQRGLADVLRAAAEIAGDVPATVTPTGVSMLGDDDAAVVLLRGGTVTARGSLRSLADRLLRATYAAGRSRQFPEFLAHATLGYGAEVEGLRLPDGLRVVALVVKRGDEVLLTLPVRTPTA
jgi:2'-5' RNA ligase